MSVLYENELIKVEIEESEIPWLKIFTQKAYKEFSETPANVKLEIFKALDIIEKEMLYSYKPKKINIASFGNYVPHVHWHVMARFEEDSYFPEPMWGKKQREGTYVLENFNEFTKSIALKLSK
ncbi:MAG: Diadenosine tetraphosphate (Ap4A) hydrolase and other HIT family hydrolases [uncultured Sulfurovum sp.]|uniref:Diadenosine tetraphosphate (Ap4A) hydrolase and other HIT family hydrolases n=1 Tax=uncultured Sulfurovum sp. TaxID=269237 RepID=A0A6S6TQF7_9BACT|nr:MAG: Diadenosine tetraphosphate (Ap4A) hydrolase and other HIT family hydrolases [uncultured Sulfurovum sp.]